MTRHASRRMIRIRSLAACMLLAVWSSAQAVVQFTEIPAATAPASIANIGGVPVLPFDLTPQAAIADNTTGVTTIPGVPSPATGSLTVAPALHKVTMATPFGWYSEWTNGYAGPIFSSDPGDRTLTLTLPPRTTAFYLYAEPNNYDTHDVTATTDSGATGAVSVTSAEPPANSVVPGIGFYTTTPGEAIQTITVSVPTISLAIASFGLAQAPAAPDMPNAPAAGLEQATLTFTPPSDTGTEPLTGYTATCTPQGGGTPVTATGSASPITVSGLTGGTPYDCAVAATSAAGTGPASAPQAVTPQGGAPAATTPTAVPTLGGSALLLLGMMAAAFGARRLRRD